MLKNAIVLTGGIASGKSTVSALMQLFGFRVIDADKIAHGVLDDSSSEIAKLFGKEYIVESKVDRKRLGSLIFGSKDKRLQLESIMHPKIREKILIEAKKQESFNKPYLRYTSIF